jgi:hypothetical protein
VQGSHDPPTPAPDRRLVDGEAYGEGTAGARPSTEEHVVAHALERVRQTDPGQPRNGRRVRKVRWPRSLAMLTALPRTPRPGARVRARIIVVALAAIIQTTCRLAAASCTSIPCRARGEAARGRGCRRGWTFKAGVRRGSLASGHAEKGFGGWALAASGTAAEGAGGRRAAGSLAAGTRVARPRVVGTGAVRSRAASTGVAGMSAAPTVTARPASLACMRLRPSPPRPASLACMRLRPSPPRPASLDRRRMADPTVAAGSPVAGGRAALTDFTGPPVAAKGATAGRVNGERAAVRRGDGPASAPHHRVDRQRLRDDLGRLVEPVERRSDPAPLPPRQGAKLRRKAPKTRIIHNPLRLPDTPVPHRQATRQSLPEG